MAKKYPDGTILILREKGSLKKQVLAKGEIYLFDIKGERTLKIYDSRLATKDEIAKGISYTSLNDGKRKVRILRSINTTIPEIIVDGEGVDWIGWLDPKDNQ